MTSKRLIVGGLGLSLVALIGAGCDPSSTAAPAAGSEATERSNSPRASRQDGGATPGAAQEGKDGADAGARDHDAGIPMEGGGEAADDTEPQPFAHDTMLRGHAGGTVDYTLEWSWQGAAWSDDIRAWVVGLDDGAFVQVRSLAVASTSFELIECATSADAGASTTARLWKALRWLNPLAASVARAHHPAYTEGPSYLRAPVAQQVVEAAALDLGAASLDDADYCELHQVLEPTLAEGLLDSQTLAVEATYFPSADDAGQPIDAAIALPMAALPALTVVPMAQGMDVRVRVTRRVVDALRATPWTSSPLDLAYELSRALANETDVEVMPAGG